MARIRVYTTAWCGHCERAKELLDAKNVPYDEIDLEGDPAFRSRLRELTGRWTVPQIVINDQPIGGYTELWWLERAGRLDELLDAA